MSSNTNIARRNAFNRMDEQSVATLRQHKPRIMELLGAILGDFYAHLSKFPETQRMFRDTGHAERAKGAQVSHWSLICDARFDDAYEASVRRIGHTHHRLGLTTEWYIGGYNFLMTEFLTRLAAELGMVSSAAKRKEIADIQAAFTKAALYDMSVAISIYLDAEKKEKEVTLASLASMFQDSIGSIVMSVTSAAQQLKGAAASMNDVAVDAANQANIVSASSEETSTNVHAVAAATEELSTSVREISQTVSTSAQIGQEAVRNAVNTVAKVQELSDAASKIGTIIKLISDIASQTNLLALNATIEAARAGEAGRGFAVVAQEVKQLADQTSKATNEIANQISAIQMATTGSADAIDGISKLIRQMSEFSTAIAAAVEEQGAATDEISRNVQMASRGTQEVTANISGVTRAVGHSRDAASSVLGSADELGGLADRLHGEVTGFLQKVRAA